MLFFANGELRPVYLDIVRSLASRRHARPVTSELHRSSPTASVFSSPSPFPPSPLPACPRLVHFSPRPTSAKCSGRWFFSLATFHRVPRSSEKCRLRERLTLSIFHSKLQKNSSKRDVNERWRLFSRKLRSLLRDATPAFDAIRSQRSRERTNVRHAIGETWRASSYAIIDDDKERDARVILCMINCNPIVGAVTVRNERRETRVASRRCCSSKPERGARSPISEITQIELRYLTSDYLA